MRFPRLQSARFLAAGAALLVHGGIALAMLVQEEVKPPAATMQIITVALMEKKAAPNPAPAPEPEPVPPQPVTMPEPPKPVEPEPLPVTERPTPIPKPVKQPPKPVQKPVEKPEKVQVAKAAPAPVQPEIPDTGRDDLTQEAVEATVTPPIFNAAYLHNPPPVYPRIARRLKQEGTVELRVRVTPEGTAAELAVARSAASRCWTTPRSTRCAGGVSSRPSAATRRWRPG